LAWVSLVDFMKIYWQKSGGYFLLSEAYDVKVKVAQWPVSSSHLGTWNVYLTFKHRIKSHLPFAGIIRSSPYSPRFQDKG